MASFSLILLSSMLLVRWHSWHSNKMSWLLWDFITTGKNRRYSCGIMNFRLKFSFDPQATHWFTFSPRSYSPVWPTARPLGSKDNRIRMGSSQTNVASPLFRYHSAFLRSIVHNSSPSGASMKQLSYNGLLRVARLRFWVVIRELKEATIAFCYKHQKTKASFD